MSKTAVQMVEEGIAFVQRAGLKVEAMERGYVRCRMPLKGNENHIGTMYAGALYTLAEIPGGALFLSSFDTSRYFPIIREHRIRYTGAVTSDALVELRMEDAEIDRIQQQADAHGKAEFTLDTTVTDTEGNPVAESEGVYQLRSQRR